MNQDKHPAPTQWIIFTLLAFAAVMIITGCSSANQARVIGGDTYSPLREIHQVLSDGRTVTCLGRGNGGLSCDWANAQKAGE